MFSAPFDYYRAGSLEEAITLLGQHQGAKVLAGGHSLVPMMKLRLAQPPALVDIGRLVELKGITRAEGRWRIGALTPHAEVAASPELRQHCRVVAEAAAKIGDPQVRNKATVGGNVAHADPASDLPAALRVVDATFHLVGPNGPRTVAVDDFFRGLLTTAVEPGEILTAIEVPGLGAGTGSCYLKVEHPASGYAVCGAAAVVAVDGSGRCTTVRLCFNGIAAVPVDAGSSLAPLVGKALDASSARSALTALAVDDPLGDAHASGEYRVHLAQVYGQRALVEAAARARAA